MNTSNRFLKAPLLLAAALTIPVVTNGCSEVAALQDAVCCTEFKAGASIDAKVGGDARAQVAVQAVADFAGIASAAVEDLTSACRGMAGELGASKDDLDKAENTTADKPADAKRAKMQAYCTLALSSIATLKATAGASFKLDFQPPVCEAPVSAKANCQAKCDVKGECKANAELPKCTGGKLEISCKGSCAAKPGQVSVSCSGSCKGMCSGGCNASGGVAVQCNGRCEGKCSADAQGNGNGVNAQGECAGFCDAKCTANATAPAVSCSGSCEGSCEGTCEASATGPSVKCDGDCTGTAEPIKCTGGKLEGGCNVDAKCEGNCDASIKAKAECKPPSLNVSFSGAANAEAAARLQAVFEANLGIVLAFKARLEGMLELGATITGNVDAVAEIKASCIPAVIAAAVVALEDVKASADVSVQLIASPN